MKNYKKLYQQNLINYNTILNGLSFQSNNKIDLTFFLIQKMKLEKIGKFFKNINTY